MSLINQKGDLNERQSGKDGKKHGRSLRRTVLRVRSAEGGQERPTQGIGGSEAGDTDHQHKKTGNGGRIFSEVGDDDFSDIAAGWRGVAWSSESERLARLRGLAKRFLREFSALNIRAGAVLSPHSEPVFVQDSCFICGAFPKRYSSDSWLRVSLCSVKNKVVPICSHCIGSRINIARHAKLSETDDLVIARWLALGLFKKRKENSND